MTYYMKPQCMFQNITCSLKSKSSTNPIVFNLINHHNVLYYTNLCCSSKGKALTQLDLSQNSLSSVPTPALKSLDRLLIFNLNHNKISAIHANAFEGMSTLEILTLYENRLTNIEPNAFAGTEKYILAQTYKKILKTPFIVLFNWSAGNSNVWTSEGTNWTGCRLTLCRQWTI